MERILERLREGVSELSVQFGDPSDCPITVSSGSPPTRSMRTQ